MVATIVRHTRERWVHMGLLQLLRGRPEEQSTDVPEESVSVADFMRADFVIPSSGGSMADSYSGSKSEADSVVDRYVDAAKEPK